MGFARIKELNGNEYVYWTEAYRDDEGKPKQKSKYLCKIEEVKQKFKVVINQFI